ncbi:MAG: hypothetical protein IT378_11580 [Sandaracinaceae bacterium]|nr:hypothetical protein [Sandaracinaceae bacterium]
MRWVFAAVMLVHGLIHLMGFLKAFGIAELPQLKRPIGKPMGVVWLAACAAVLTTVVVSLVWPADAWMIGVAALVLSQVAIVSSWSDAKFGTLANAILFVAVLVNFLSEGPTSFPAQMREEVTRELARPQDAPVVTEADLEPLPAPVRRYVRATGFVGQPRVHNYRLRFRGRLRTGPDAGWMPFEVEQQSFARPSARYFLMRASMFGVPAQAYHRFAGQASMRVVIAGLYPMVDERGPEMDRAETVTLFNDMCILAPGTLLDPAIVWEPAGDRTANARFTHGAHTIRATLLFDEQGLLANFVSDDRSRNEREGRFTTPVRNYRSYGPYRIASYGEAHWHPPEGEYSYGEFELVDLAYNVSAAD